MEFEAANPAGRQVPTVTVPAVAATVTEEQARQSFKAARRCALRRGRPLAVELLHLPHWLFVHEVLTPPGPGGETGSEAAPEPMAVLVCRLSGQAAHVSLADHEIAPAPEPLPPALDATEARTLAIEFVGSVLLMAARGRRRRECGPMLRSEPCSYPYWVEYVRRGRRLDFRALDAVSGKPAGAAVRGAIARGLAGR